MYIGQFLGNDLIPPNRYLKDIVPECIICQIFCDLRMLELRN